jgi:hypothetical protein
MTHFRILAIAALAVGVVASSHLNQARAEEEAATSKPAKVEPVEYTKLKALMPAKAGTVDQSSNEGEKQELNEWVMSRARADYTIPDADDKAPSAFVEIMDFGAAPHLVAGMTAWRSVPLNIENDDGFQKTGKFKEFPCFQSYTKSDEHRTMMLLVADRFLVNIETSNMTADQFKTLAEGLQLDKLAKLK